MFLAVNKNPTKLGQWLFYTNYFFLTNASPLLSKLFSKKYLQLSIREAHLNRKIIYVVAIITHAASALIILMDLTPHKVRNQSYQ